MIFFWQNRTSGTYPLVRLCNRVSQTVFCLLLFFLQPLDSLSQVDQPNILLIQVDDMGYDDLAVNGNTLSQTPNIDQLANESVQFGNYMLASVCSPTRASLLTGRDFWRTGVSGMHGGNDFMHLDETTFAEILQRNGYATGMWGKWHSGKADGYWPWDRGFDEGYYAKLYKHFPSSGIYNGEDVSHPGKWSDEQIVDYAIDFISRNKDKPFFAYVSSLTCHGIWDAPDGLISTYRDAGYSDPFSTLLGMLELMDREVGRLLNFLEEQALAENTIVIFMSDNGPISQGETNEEWDLRNNHGFLGNKARNWQNGLKSPLYIRWKNNYLPGQVNRLVSVTDIFPTILDLSGIPVPQENLPLDGRSIKSYLEGDTMLLPEKQAIFVHWSPERGEQQFAPILPDDIPDLNPEIQSMTLINERYKLLYNPVNVEGSPAKYNGHVLIDLRLDPMELNNIAQANPEVVDSMSRTLEEWFASIISSGHPFARPVFQIGTRGKKISSVLAYGPYQVVGATNDAHYVKNFDATGDKVSYHVKVHQPGMYAVKMSSINNGLDGMKVKTTIGRQKIITDLSDGYTQEIGQFFIGAGRNNFSFEIVGLDASKSPFMEELRLFEFELQEALSGLSDLMVTRETAMLFKSLKEIAPEDLIFGHHNASFEGQHWKDESISVNFNSDCYLSVGDHPGLVGFDFVRGIDKFKVQVEEIFRRGGVITYSWHAKNPVTGGSYYDSEGDPVASILDGGTYWDAWRSELDKIAEYFNSLQVDNVKVPIIFRPFHENTGSWFWWGTGNCTEQEYVDLWRLTVDYLRKEKGVDNLLLAYSPSKPVNDSALSMRMYPGDDYVDIIGFDCYDYNDKFQDLFMGSAQLVSQWASEKNKVSAVTEAGIRNGLQNSTGNDWFMSELLIPLKNDSLANQLAFFLTWRNSATDSYWVPLQGQANHQSFVDFYNDETTLFLDDLNDLYDNPFGLLKYNIKIVVRDELDDELIQDCSVRINNVISITDQNGSAYFVDVLEAFTLVAESDGFDTYSRTVNISSDTTLVIYIRPADKSLEINFKDKQSLDPIWGVRMHLNEEFQVSNMEGIASFSLPAGLYNYRAERDAYQILSGTLDLYCDSSIILLLERTHADIKFRLREGETPINKAIVKIDQDSLESNNLGIVLFDYRPIHREYSFSVRREGFNEQNGYMYLTNDTTVHVEMIRIDTSTSGFIHSRAQLQVWPNPASERISVSLEPSPVPGIIRIMDIQGKIVYEAKREASSFTICVEDLLPGIYLLQYSSRDGFTNTRFIKEKSVS